MSDQLWVEIIRAFGPTLVAVGGIVGIVVQNRRTHRKIGTVEAQVQPNGGSSMRDAVNTIRDDVRTLRDEVGTVHRRIDDHLADCAQQGRRRR